MFFVICLRLFQRVFMLYPIKTTMATLTIVKVVDNVARIYLKRSTQQ